MYRYRAYSSLGGAAGAGAVMWAIGTPLVAGLAYISDVAARNRFVRPKFRMSLAVFTGRYVLFKGTRAAVFVGE